MKSKIKELSDFHQVIQKEMEYIQKKTQDINICTREDGGDICSRLRHVGIKASGNYIHVVAGNDHNKVVSCGTQNHICLHGYKSNLYSRGSCCHARIYGNYSKSAFESNKNRIHLFGGNAELYSVGEADDICVSGHHSLIAASGNEVSLSSYGQGNILVSLGQNSVVSGVIGNYFSSGTRIWRVDGLLIKENIFYQMIDDKLIKA